MKEYNKIPPTKLMRAIAIANRYGCMRQHLLNSYTEESIKLEVILADIKWEWNLDSWFLDN